MTQPNKKPSPAQSSAKLASGMAGKAAKTTYAAVESTRNSAENVVNIGNKVVADSFATITDEAQKAQEKVFELGREGAEQFARSADVATKALYEAISLSRDNIETCIECGNMTASLAKEMSGEIFDFANKSFSDNMELSKEFFSCRTINDMLELQNRIVKSSIDNYFNQAVKLSGMVFEYSTEALDPVNERISQATDQFSKILTDA